MTNGVCLWGEHCLIMEDIPGSIKLDRKFKIGQEVNNWTGSLKLDRKCKNWTRGELKQLIKLQLHI